MSSAKLGLPGIAGRVDEYDYSNPVVILIGFVAFLSFVVPIAADRFTRHRDKIGQQMPKELESSDLFDRFLVAVFLNEPDKSWSLREITIAIASDPIPIFDSLSRLVHLGWLNEQDADHKTFFTLTVAGAAEGRAAISDTQSTIFHEMLDRGISLPEI